LAARARYFCLDTKVPKKSSQQIGFFAAQAFTLQSNQNHGCNYFAPLHSRLPLLLQKLAKPFPTLGPPLFCLLSPEA